ncbi:putative catabolite repression protein creC [Iris pallida]|uniref:Catabolite repression protein creC n=1 Tax=Iris pallida TaxID=29817 RepID=A0AAX6FGA4_IRIPA|nr:putative catabolite repression protein creC [Iris pallida]
MSSPSPSSTNAQSQTLKTSFKTIDGRYNLRSEKLHPFSFLQFSHSKSISQLTVAHLKEKQPAMAQQPLTPQTPSGGVRSAAARFLGAGNGSRALSFVGASGSGKVGSASSRIGTGAAAASASSSVSGNYDGKGTYLVFNVGDSLFVSDLNTQDKDPIKAISFGNSIPVCHAFRAEVKDGHDLLVGTSSGDVYLVSLRQQLQDVGKKLVGAQHYNRDGTINSSRCMSIAWVPGCDGAFVVAHADGNLYAYEKNKDGNADCSFPVIKDQTQFAVSHARSSKSNPVARWHICQGSVNNISFSTDGTYLATVGRDGYLRVFDYSKEQLICGGKSYYAALLCCSWSSDGKYILTGGEDDLVQVWSMEERKIVAWGEGHNSWVSGVAFDSYWSAPNSEVTGENVMYHFGSVGQDARLLLWDLVMDEICVPLRCPPGGSPTFSNGSHSAHWDICPVGTLQPAPSMRDVPKLSPVVAHRVHVEPLSGLVFTNESVLTICREGHIKVWARPGQGTDSNHTVSETTVGITVSKDQPILPSGKAVSSTNKQSPPFL